VGPAGLRWPGQDVVAGGLDRREGCPASAHVSGDGDPRSAVQMPDERRSVVEQVSRPGHLERHQLAKPAARHAAPQLFGADAEAFEVFGRQVHTSRGVVLGDVLPVLAS